MLRILIVFFVFTLGCGTPSVTKKHDPQVSNEDTLLADTFRNEKIITNDTFTEADAYKSSILSYKDSIDSKIMSLKKVNREIEGSSEGGEAILYLSGRDTLRINAIFYGETGKSTYVFYIRNKYPVLYIDTTILYNEPIFASRKVKIKSITIDELILRNNTVVGDLQVVNNERRKSAEEITNLYARILNLLTQ